MPAEEVVLTQSGQAATSRLTAAAGGSVRPFTLTGTTETTSEFPFSVGPEAVIGDPSKPHLGPKVQAFSNNSPSKPRVQLISRLVVYEVPYHMYCITRIKVFGDLLHEQE